MIAACKQQWRLSRKKRKMSYGYFIYCSTGDIFERVFSPVALKLHTSIPTDSPNPEPSSSFNLTNNVPSLSTGVFRNLKFKMQYRVFGQEKSLFDLDKAVWDEDAEIFFINYAKKVNDLF